MSDETFETSERTLTLLGVGLGLMQLIVFTGVGVLILDSIPYAIVVGGFAGVGTFLFLPWFLSLSAAQEEGDTGFDPALEASSRSAGVGVFGLGLEIGGISMLALAFVQNQSDLPLGVVSAFTVAVAVYLAGSFVLSR